MKDLLATLAVLAIVGSSLSVVRADDCICKKTPMYQVSGGWFHYAVVYDLPSGGSQNCINKYPTGLIGTYAVNQECGALCGDCQSLGSDITSIPDFHFEGAPLSYQQLDEPAEFRSYLEKLAGAPGPIPQYDDFTFSQPRVVSLKRPSKEGPQAFHAVVWKLESKGAGPKSVSYAGAEISGAPASVASTAVADTTNAVHSVKTGNNGQISHSAIPGLLQVQISTTETAFIRLSKSQNSGAQYPPCNKNSDSNLAQGGTCCNTVAAGDSCCQPRIRRRIGACRVPVRCCRPCRCR
jgi:hypothetical protein